jgi:hypothetical protein
MFKPTLALCAAETVQELNERLRLELLELEGQIQKESLSERHRIPGHQTNGQRR